MGCTGSLQVRPAPRSSEELAVFSKLKAINPLNAGGAASVQDEARLFRSTVGAIKVFTKNEASYLAFQNFLDQLEMGEYLKCFMDITEIMALDEMQMTSRTAALVWRYRALYDTAKAESNGQDIPSSKLQYVRIWEGVGKMCHSNILKSSRETLMKFLCRAQNDMLSNLVTPFDNFLRSPIYTSWQATKIEEKKHRMSLHSPDVTTASTFTSLHSEDAPPQPQATPTFAESHPNVLIVEDSNMTMRIAVRVMERDGHSVQKATDGEMALKLMKQNKYDVVLIDINMPRMDGFEVVRLFRQYEKNLLGVKNVLAKQQSGISDLSDTSGSDDDVEPSARSPPPETSCTVQTQKPLSNLAWQTSNSSPEHAGTTDEIHTKDVRLCNSVKEKNACVSDSNNHDTSNNNTNTSTTNNANNPSGRNMSSAMSPSHKSVQEKSLRNGAVERQLIIGMSSCVGMNTQLQAIETGMDSFIPKPFTLEKFINALSVSIRARKASKPQNNDVMRAEEKP